MTICGSRETRCRRRVCRRQSPLLVEQLWNNVSLFFVVEQLWKTISNFVVAAGYIHLGGRHWRNKPCPGWSERSFEWTHESCTLLSCHCIRQKIPFVRQVPGCRCTWYWRQWIMTMTIRKWVIDDNMQLRVDGQVKNDNSQSTKMQHMMEPFVVELCQHRSIRLLPW